MEAPRVILGDQENVTVLELSHQADREVFSFHSVLATIKLDNSNFTIWKHQILKILKSFELDGYVKESLTEFLKNGSLNLEYKFWEKQDEMMDCWLMSCMIDEILTLISGFDTSRLG